MQQGHVLIPTEGPRGTTEALVVGWRVRTQVKDNLSSPTSLSGRCGALVTGFIGATQPLPARPSWVLSLWSWALRKNA